MDLTVMDDVRIIFKTLKSACDDAKHGPGVRHFANRPSVCAGVTVFVLGCLTIIAQSVQNTFDGSCNREETGYCIWSEISVQPGLWCGPAFVFFGLFSVMTGKCANRCLVATHGVFSILSVILAGVLISLSGIDLGLSFTSAHIPLDNFPYTIKYIPCSDASDYWYPIEGSNPTTPPEYNPYFGQGYQERSTPAAPQDPTWWESWRQAVPRTTEQYNWNWNPVPPTTDYYWRGWNYDRTTRNWWYNNGYAGTPGWRYSLSTPQIPYWIGGTRQTPPVPGSWDQTTDYNLDSETETSDTTPTPTPVSSWNKWFNRKTTTPAPVSPWNRWFNWKPTTPYSWWTTSGWQPKVSETKTVRPDYTENTDIPEINMNNYDTREDDTDFQPLVRRKKRSSDRPTCFVRSLYLPWLMWVIMDSIMALSGFVVFILSIMTASLAFVPCCCPPKNKHEMSGYAKPSDEENPPCHHDYHQHQQQQPEAVPVCQTDSPTVEISAADIKDNVPLLGDGSKIQHV